MEGLQRKAMPGGGEVFTGEVASRALKEMGARAMTVDRSIIVSEEFDPNKPEDQALYAHEQYHQEHSGGEGPNSGRDSEEVAARAVERMVLHRARSGGVESHEATQTQHGGFGGGNQQQPAQMQNRTDGQNQVARGYWALRDSGLSHLTIADRMADQVLKALDRARSLKDDRGGDKKGWQ
jgi:hypothetical protein